MRAAARPRARLPVGHRADLRHHRPLHDRGGLRGRRRDRARGLGGPAGRARRPAAAGGLLHADGRRAGPVRLRRGGARHRRQDDRAPPARLRRRRGRGQRRAHGRSGRSARRRSARRKGQDDASVLADVPAGLPGTDPGPQAAEAGGPGRLRLGCGRRRSWPRSGGDRRARGRARRGRCPRPSASSSWAICCSPSSTSPATWRSIPRRRCGRPTPSSSGASAASRRRPRHGAARSAT